MTALSASDMDAIAIGLEEVFDPNYLDCRIEQRLHRGSTTPYGRTRNDRIGIYAEAFIIRSNSRFFMIRISLPTMSMMPSRWNSESARITDS